MRFLFLVLNIIIIINSCDENPIMEKDKSFFSIYFLKDDRLKMKDIYDKEISELELASSPWLSEEDIEFYDWSSHCIYLKKDKSCFFGDIDSFDLESFYSEYWRNKPFIVTENANNCYMGYFLSTLSSDIWPYPDITEIYVKHYPKDVIYIEFPFSFTNDKRNNEDVRNALIDLNLLHEGLYITIDSLWIDNADTATVRYMITINNDDTDNLYVLDPDKMGTELFHYFTNGPILYNSTNNKIYNSIYKKIIKPDPFNYYDSNWFTKIESCESIARMIILKGYPHLEEGNYYCSFSFNNPYYINKDERILSDGRYWIGPTRSELIGFNFVDSEKKNSNMRAIEIIGTNRRR